MTVFEKVKKHLEDNKDVYILIAIGVSAAAFTTIIMRERIPLFNSAPENSTEFNIRPLTFLSRNVDQSTHIVNVVEREGRGHPGYIIRCLETKELFPSQTKTAEVFGGNSTSLTGHLQGKFPDFCGYHFERVGVLI